MKSLYLERASREQRRLLNLLDRNPSSQTYGCFDRSYWLHRKTDFAASTAQLSLSTLAHMYVTPFSGNVLYNEPTTLEWIKATLTYTLTIQHSDGSFDEWYPNEKGWGGPTGYVTHAIMETLKLVGDQLPQELKTKTMVAMTKAAYHLAKRDEGHTLANHHAIALLGLAEVAYALDDETLKQQVRIWTDTFKTLVTDEGWTLEYDGCDIGYNLGTLNFLADLHQLTGDSYWLEYARSSFGFLSYFAYPDGTWAGSLGSRHTLHSYFFALEYWATLLPEAYPLLAHQRDALKKGIDLSPGDQEDHYLHYRLADYLKAAKIDGVSFTNRPLLPYEAEQTMEKYFSRSGFYIRKTKKYIFWAALHRGGAYRLYEIPSGRLLDMNNGCLLESEDGAIYTSLWQGSHAFKSGAIGCEGPLIRLFQKRFTPVSFILFRLACLCMFFPLPAQLFKRWIRRRLIFSTKSDGPSWKRQFVCLENELKVEDRVDISEIKTKRFFWGGDFHSRFVPQALYFSPAEVRFPPRELAYRDFIKDGKLTVKHSITTNTYTLDPHAPGAYL